jgi:ketosteroid isomerase-like protein
MTFCLLVPLLFASASPAPTVADEQARVILDKLTAAGKAKDVNAVSRLLSKDCIIMPEAVGVSARARFFTRNTYLEALKQRFSETTAINSKGVIRNIATNEQGDVFVTMDVEERARIGTRSEWVRSHEYLVMRPGGNDLLIAMVVSEMFFYAPDVPPEPTAEPRSNGTQ